MIQIAQFRLSDLILDFQPRLPHVRTYVRMYMVVILKCFFMQVWAEAWVEAWEVVLVRQAALEAAWVSWLNVCSCAQYAVLQL